METSTLCPYKIGHKIRVLRLKSKISNQHLCSILYVNYRTLIGWQNGNNLPSLKNVVKLCNYFSIKVDDLVFYKDS